MSILLTDTEQLIVKNILLLYLPTGAKVWAFGSRARGKAKKFSDLDLAVDCAGEACSLSVLAQISFDFEESDLSFKVDLVDLNTIDSHFRQQIEGDSTLILHVT